MADVQIAIVSDTHVPSHADEIPDWVADRIRDADRVLHAGDFDGAETYERIAGLADRLTAVRGNTDPPALDLPWVEAVEIAGTTFVLTHGHRTEAGESYREGIARAVSEEVDGPAIAVAGHTHELVDEDVEGIRLLNPGSATGVSPAERATMLTVEIERGEVRVEVHEE